MDLRLKFLRPTGRGQQGKQAGVYASGRRAARGRLSLSLSLSLSDSLSLLSESLSYALPQTPPLSWPLVNMPVCVLSASGGDEVSRHELANVC
jgi:hypothetical protein